MSRVKPLHAPTVDAGPVPLTRPFEAVTPSKVLADAQLESL